MCVARGPANEALSGATLVCLHQLRLPHALLDVAKASEIYCLSSYCLYCTARKSSKNCLKELNLRVTVAGLGDFDLTEDVRDGEVGRLCMGDPSRSGMASFPIAMDSCVPESATRVVCNCA